MAATRVRCKFIELYDSIFLGSKNYPTKIDAEKMDISIHRVIDGSRVEYHFQTPTASRLIESSLVKQCDPYDAKEAGFLPYEGTKPKAAPLPGPVQQGKVKAQVSAPNGIKI